MYPLGQSLCTWYAGMLAMTLARLDMPDRAAEILRNAVRSTGCFSEIFEIYEIGYRPYFGTAEGIFLQATNELYVKCPAGGKDDAGPARRKR